MKCSGFKTEKGSIYAFNDEGKTVRYKKSTGMGQGTVREPSECLFLPPKEMPVLERHGLGNGHMDYSIKLGMTEAREPKTFLQFKDSVSIPEGYQPIVVIMDRKTGQVIHASLAAQEPIAGHIPVQKRYNPNGTSSTHIGHAVVEIYRDPEELARNAPPELLAAIEYPPRTNTGLHQRPRALAPVRS